MVLQKTVLAPAKVNFCLHVCGKRDDGYHDLAMLMQRVSLYDRLRITLEAGRGVVVECPGVVLPQGQVNLVEQAARLFMDYCGIDRRVTIVVDKEIPAAAGLGGGSSDAAAVLTTLNAMLDAGLPCHELMALGLQLGADIPFFLYRRTAWVTGVGDRLQPWPGLPPLWLVLVNPGIAVSTAWVFRNLGLTHHRPIAKLPGFPAETSALVRLLHNDLEVVTCQHHPVITTIKDNLIASGARGALMSGSGPTVFGLFDDRRGADKAAGRLARETDWWLRVVAPI